MVRKRLITVLTFCNGVLFRTKDFIPDYRYTLNFVDAWSIDEIILLDVTRNGNDEDRKCFYEVVSDFASKCFVPLTIGGGIRNIDEISYLLRIGADKVAINTIAFEKPEFIKEASQIFGSQCIVVSIDAKKQGDSYEVFTHCGTKDTGIDPVNWARKVESLGAGEILISSIDRDGALEGYDISLGKKVAGAVKVPVLLCSGAGKWQDFLEGFKECNVDAVCTTNIYHFTESSIKSAKNYLYNNNIMVRK